MKEVETRTLTTLGRIWVQFEDFEQMRMIALQQEAQIAALEKHRDDAISTLQKMDRITAENEALKHNLEERNDTLRTAVELKLKAQAEHEAMKAHLQALRANLATPSPSWESTLLIQMEIFATSAREVRNYIDTQTPLNQEQNAVAIGMGCAALIADSIIAKLRARQSKTPIDGTGKANYPAHEVKPAESKTNQSLRWEVEKIEGVDACIAVIHIGPETIGSMPENMAIEIANAHNATLMP